MSKENRKVLLITFDEESKSYQAFSEIKEMAGNGTIKGREMAVVTHKVQGGHTFEVNDFINFNGDTHIFNDGFIGMLIGILGGFVGMLIGWVVGDIVGAVRDSNDGKRARNLFEQMNHDIPDGETGVILVADETDNHVINEVIVEQLGGKITRFDYTEVEADIKHAQEIEHETKKEAKHRWNKKQDNK